MKPTGEVHRWYLSQVESWGKGDEKKWREKGRKVVKRYRDDRAESDSQTKFNILYSNVETLKPAVFSRVPEPDVRRRFVDIEGNPDDPRTQQRDKAERDAAELIERALQHAVDDGSFEVACERARDDMLLPGRGVVKIEYDCDITKRYPQAVETEMGTVYMLNGAQVQPDGVDEDGFAYIEEKTNERVVWRYWYWEDVRFSPARCWSDLWGLAFRHCMTREELVERFGEEIGKKVRLSLGEDDKALDDRSDDDPLKAEVWEVWNHSEKKQVFVSPGYDDVMEENDDPLGLSGFFPMPEPLYAIRTTDTMVPIPEFCVYQDQADELDEIMSRLSNLEKTLKSVGLYNAVQEEIKNLRDMKDGQLYPVEDPANLQASGGLKNNIWMLPIDEIAAVIVQLSQRAEELKRHIYEITGISDLVRGATRASETATAQELKGRFGQLRMVPRARPMERFIRGLYRIGAEIIVENFSARTLAQMTGIEVAPDVLSALREDRLRSYMVDIETEATVAIDAEAEKQEAIELTTAMTQFIQAWASVIQVAPMTLPLAMEMMKFTFRRFKAGRSFEDTVDMVAAQLKQIAAQPQQPEQPDPAKMAEVESRERIAAMQTQGQLAQTEMKAEADIMSNFLDVQASPNEA